MRFSLRQFEVLQAIADQRGVSAAARALRQPQPAVTRYLRELEQEVGSALFERSAKGMVPTSAGDALLHRARAICAELRAIEQDVRMAGIAATTRLAVGISPAITSVVPILLRFQAESGVHLLIREDLNRMLLPLLRDGELDLVVSPLLPDEVSDGLARRVIDYNRVAIVVRHGHPLAGRARVAAVDLLAFPWVLPSRAIPARIQLETAFHNATQLPPQPFIECDSLRVTREILVASDAISIMAEGSAGHDVGNGILTILDAAVEFPLRPIAVFARARPMPSRVAKELADLLEREMRAGIP